jgi:hypothetical protein
MNQLFFWIVLATLLFIIIYLDARYLLLRDNSTAQIKPFSYARVQLAWWTLIILTSLISIIISTGKIPAFDKNILILLGITAGVTLTARLIDLSDDANAYSKSVQIAQASSAGLPTPPPIILSRNQNSQDFILDILSDKSGVSIHRLQAVIFNIIFGIWFIYNVYMAIEGLNGKTAQPEVDKIMQIMKENYLMLIGLSAGTYATIKATENK